MKKLFALVVIIAIAVSIVTLLTPDAETLPSPDPITARVLEQGELVGFVTENGGHAWLGIPYATPPIADLRWRAPRPPKPWQGTLSALKSGSPCVQIGGPLGGVSPDQYGDIVGDEDCLFLNVWAPSSIPAEGLPVMVWIHGGGNTIGQAADYDGRFLAVQEQVIVVGINYRLGIFGWMTHPVLHAGGDQPLDASGNFGTLDTIAALDWVHDNISAFGGDAGNVTLFGESAGGRNVLALMTSPQAEGLFHRAIVQSGIAQGVPVDKATAAPDAGGDPNSSAALLARWLVDGGHADSASTARELISSGDQSVADTLRQLDSDTLMGVFGSALGGMFEAPQLFEDGIVLPELPQFAAFSQPGAIHDVPIILGTNRDEMKLFMAQSPRYVEKTFGVFIKQLNVSDYDLEAAYRSRYWKALGVDELARAMTATGKTDVYAYRFDWDEGADTVFADLGALLGASHGLEIPFVFGDFSDFFGNTLVFDDASAESREQVSRAMMGYWASFARDGRPSGTELPGWPSWSDGQYMRFDSLSDGGMRMSDETESINALVMELAGETGFSDAATLCRVFAVNNYGTPWWNEAAYSALANGACADYPAAEQPRF